MYQNKCKHNIVKYIFLNNSVLIESSLNESISENVFIILYTTACYVQIKLLLINRRSRNF